MKKGMRLFGGKGLNWKLHSERKTIFQGENHRFLLWLGATMPKV